MKYRNLIITLGFIVILIQFLGFPQSWRDVLYTLVGLLVITFGYLSEKERKVKPTETPAPTSTTSS